MEQVIAANWRSLIRPRGIERDKRSTDTYGKFVVRPLERGFGITLGNALRRILLSSLQGAAITSVRIDGALHEFSSLPGVVEDITDIVLNLKGVRIRTSSTKPLKASIDRSGEKGRIVQVTAGDITFDGEATVLNPDHPIATLTETGRFVAELTVEMGKGYVPGQMDKSPQDQVIGTIPVDALHSPIRKVKYTVTNARVKQRTDYDKLTLEVWTDGSVAPEDAVAYAAKILKEQVQVFINFVEEPEPSEDFEAAEQEWNENLFKRVDELDLSVRSGNCLQNAGIEYIWQLVEKSEAELLKTKNFGRKSLNEIKELLAELNLSLGMKLHNFPKNRAS